MPKTPLKPTDKRSNWTPKHAVDIYRYALAGSTYEEIAKKINCPLSTFKGGWMLDNPECRYAVEQGYADRKSAQENTFKAYLEERLSPTLRKLWDEIEYWADNQDGVGKIEELLAPHGGRARQQLWLHAMLETNFDTTKSCKMLNISFQMLNRWKNDDPDFPALLDEMLWHKKNYFENALMGLTAMRSERAIIHANKTLNKDRGYGDKLEMTVNGTITHNHVVIPLDKLTLKLETLLDLEQAMSVLPDAERPKLPPLPEKRAIPVDSGDDDDSDE